MSIHWTLGYSREIQKKVSLCFRGYRKAFDCVGHEKRRAALKEMGVPQLLIVLVRNLHCGQEATARTEYRETGWFPVGEGVRQGCMLSSYLLNLCAEHAT